MTRRRFCPGCGDDIDQDREFCVDCKPKKDIEFKDIKFDYCSHCDSYLHKNKWKKIENEDAAVRIITKDIIRNNVEIIDVNLPQITIAPGVNVDFTFKMKIDEDEYEVPGRFLVTLCPLCSKISQATYFEGILQIRNPKPEVIEFVNVAIAKAENIFVNKTVEVRGGIDFYMSSKKFLRKLGLNLNKRFPGEFNQSAQLFSRNNQTSKEVFRLNVLFRCE